ncbi:MAG TPA: dihydrodipicolinate synthase family protein [Opitutaceae bacterium]|nr:dihydrodipicolinate synthase family protein [Opitutaceae bacterium]
MCGQASATGGISAAQENLPVHWGVKWRPQAQGADMSPVRSVHLWSALPTPLTGELQIDERSLERTLQSSIDAGVTGLFLGGTCGEGPWLPDRERIRLVRTAARFAQGRLKLAVQVSDNSGPRILDNIRAAQDAGADYGIIAPPLSMMNATEERVLDLYRSAITKSPLPMGLYDLGRGRAFAIPGERLRDIYLLPNLTLIKDSSADPERRKLALAIRAERPELRLFCGDEFNSLEYLEAGYDGLMLGGAVVTAPMLVRMIALLQAGHRAEAQAVEQEMVALLRGIYGGKALACWLTGLKYALVVQGLFATTASFLEYPLTPECRTFIDRHFAKQPGVGLAGRVPATG